MHDDKQDYQCAREYYQQAAEQGYAEAQYNLGLLKAGYGVEQDYEKSGIIFSLRLMSHQGDADTKKKLTFSTTSKGNGGRTGFPKGKALPRASSSARSRYSSMQPR